MLTRAEIQICVLGMWHLGGVTSACLADLGYVVVGYDQDRERVEGLKAGRTPVHEPGLDAKILANAATGRLRFTASLADAASAADYIIFAYDTPVDEDDAVDLSELFETASELGPLIKDGATIIVCSQVPVGTCERLLAAVKVTGAELGRVSIACVPENLRLGQAIQRFQKPDMVVIGAEYQDTWKRVDDLFSAIQAPRALVSLRTAEMTKHAINAYLATNIAFANELASLCDLVGADAMQVTDALRMESRVSPSAPLRPGSGFSGGTLARDVKILRELGKSHGFNVSLLDGVWHANQSHSSAPLRRLRQALSSLAGKTVAVLGLTYKAGTSTLRRSAALDIIRDLIAEGAEVRAYDPMADVDEMKRHGEIARFSSVEAAVDGSDAILIATPWPEFLGLDYARLAAAMKSPIVVDAHNFLDQQSMEQQGMIYLGIGRGTGPPQTGSG